MSAGRCGMIAIGVALAITAAALGTISKQLIAASEHYKRDILFHAGAVLNLVIGPIVDASAYVFAPSVIVAPFACLDVILNAVTAPKVLHWQGEKLTRAHIVGVILVALGAMATSVFSCAPPREWSVYDLEEQLFFRPLSSMFFGAELLLVLAALGSLKAKRRLGPAARGLALGGAAGLLMGNVFFAKGVISIVKASIASGSGEAWLRPTPYLLLLGALGGPLCGHVFMKKGLAEYKGVFMVTTYEGVHITVACLSGCVVMEEMSGAPWSSVVKYWCGVGLIVSGLLAINTTAKTARLRRAPSGLAAELDITSVPRKISNRGLRSKSGSGSFVGSAAVLGTLVGLWHRGSPRGEATSLVTDRALRRPPVLRSARPMGVPFVSWPASAGAHALGQRVATYPLMVGF